MVDETFVIVSFGHSWGVTEQSNKVTRNRVTGKKIVKSFSRVKLIEIVKK